jgi:hypothetical protein
METVVTRQKEYGGFHNNAEYAQQLKRIVESSPMWTTMHPMQQEALHMICSKMSRIMCNPNHKDSWHDIAGYALLIDEEL